MRSRLFPIIALLMLLLMWVTAPVAATSGGGVASFAFDCDSVIVTHLAIFLDRDNTGIGNETFTLTISDGSGNVLSSSADSGMIGEAITAATRDFDYTIAPVSNPIHVLLVSDAGNGLPEQVIWNLTGNSPCLPLPPHPGFRVSGCRHPGGLRDALYCLHHARLHRTSGCTRRRRSRSCRSDLVC